MKRQHKSELIKIQKLVNVSVDVTEEMVIKSSGGSKNKTIKKYLPEVLSLGKNLLDPQAVYKVYSVAEVGKNKLLLENGLSFNSKYLCKLFKGAEKIVVICCTIGSTLENKVKELNKKGDIVRSFLLDMYGAAAVSVVLQNLYRKIRKNYKGSGVTVHMEPGQLDWKIEEQQLLFKLISPEAIGVLLNDSMTMSPLKSVTAVFGVGDPDKVKRGEFACKVCPRREQCPFRHDPEKAFQFD